MLFDAVSERLEAERLAALDEGVDERWQRALPGLTPKATVTVEPGGTLTANKNGVLTDTFGPYETRIYSWEPRQAAKKVVPALPSGAHRREPSVLGRVG